MKLNVYTDGGSRGNPGISGLGVAIYGEDGALLEKRFKPLGVMTNNQAEYWGAFYGIRRAAEMGATEIRLHMDSQLVINQLAGRWKLKHPELKEIFAQIRDFLGGHPGLKLDFKAIPREKNTVADALSNRAMDAQMG